MATDIRFINVPDGIAPESSDLNAARDHMRALHGDMRLGQMLERSGPSTSAGSVAGTAQPSESHLFATGLGGCVGGNSTGLQVSNDAGLIHQYTSASMPDGATPVLHSYWLERDELQTSLSAADPTNPRIDLIEVQLDIEDESESRDFQDADTGEVESRPAVTRKRVRLTKNLVTGTAGATPALPSTTAGYVPWCYVWVGAAAVGLDTLTVWDMRRPMGYQRIFIPASRLIPGDAADWTQAHLSGAPRSSAGAGEELFAYVPATDPGRRFMRAFVHASSNVDLALHTQDTAHSGIVLVSSQTNTKRLTVPVGTSANSATKPGAVWCNGASKAQGNWHFDASLSTTVTDPLMLVIASRGSTDLYGVTFEILG